MFSFFFFKQKTAYEMRISDWSSDVCSSDLIARVHWINGHNRQVTQVFPFIWMQRQRRDPCRLLLHLFGKGERNSVFVNGDQTETSGGEGVTQDIRDSRGDARQPPCRSGKHKIARLGLANVPDGCCEADLLVHGTQPYFSVFALLHTAHDQFRTQDELKP